MANISKLRRLYGKSANRWLSTLHKHRAHVSKKVVTEHRADPVTENMRGVAAGE